MFKRIYENCVHRVVDVAYKHPFKMLMIFVALAALSIIPLQNIRIDTNLINLLPQDSPSVIEANALQDKVGDGGQFIVIFDGAKADSTKLKAAVDYTAERLKKFPEVRDVQYKYPREFVEKYKYLLIPNDYLNDIVEEVIKLEAKNNPFSDNIMDEESAEPEKVTHGMKENKQDMEVLLQQYLNMPDYQQSADGKVFGLLVPTRDGIASLGKIRDLYDKIKVVTDEAAKKFGVNGGISGNHRNKLVEYDKIMGDLGVASVFSFIGIFLVLLLSFRNLWQILAVILPLAFGLMWAFAFIPYTFGSLNLITSFLVVILYGIGIDFSIHLLKRLKLELQSHDVLEAMYISFSDTGLSVIMSAITTFAGFVVLMFSDFRGFYEYGILSALSILLILVAMYVVLPPLFIILIKYGIIKADKPVETQSKKVRNFYVPGRAVTCCLIVLVLVGGAVASQKLEFDYFLSNTQFSKDKNSELAILNKKRDKVYSASMSPAAIYAAPSLEALDSVNAILKAEFAKKGTMINRVRSIRDFAPNDEDLEERRDLLNELAELFDASWTEKIDDPAYKTLINDFKNWEMPEAAPKVSELPAFISSNLMGAKNSGYYLSTVYPTEERKDGRVAMKFTNQLNSLKMPANVKGPVGETIIFADVLNIVFAESGWIIICGLLAVFGVVLVMQRNLKYSLLMSIPLAGGMLLSFGICALFGVKLTFFNIVCITGLVGMGVDGGIHYVNRWLYNSRNIQVVQNQLVAPIASAFSTVIFAYIGMVLSEHSGLRSMGTLSAICMSVIMVINIFMLPGILKMIERKTKHTLKAENEE